MKTVTFTAEAWQDYLFWVENDKKILKKINRLIEQIARDPFKGSGNPEPLKFHLSGFWSRRINLKERLIYKVEKDRLLIISCRGHY